MRSLLNIFALVLIIAGVAVAGISFYSPGQVIIGITPSLGATLLVGGILAMGLAALIGAVNRLTIQVQENRPVVQIPGFGESKSRNEEYDEPNAQPYYQDEPDDVVAAEDDYQRQTPPLPESAPSASPPPPPAPAAPEQSLDHGEPTIRDRPSIAPAATGLIGAAAGAAAGASRWGGSKLKDGVDVAGDTVASVGDKTGELVSDTASGIDNMFDRAVEGAKKASEKIDDTGEKVAGSGKFGLSKASGLAAAGGAMLGAGATKATDALGSIGEKTGEIAGDAVDVVKDTGSELVDNVTDKVAGAFDLESDDGAEAAVDETAQEVAHNISDDLPDADDADHDMVADEDVVDDVHAETKIDTDADSEEEVADDAEDDDLYVVEQKHIRGRDARILSDGTVEAETDEGWMRFENVEHLEEYIDAMEGIEN